MNNQNIIIYRFNILYQILKELEEIKIVVVEMEVNLGKEKRKGLTLCARDENGYYPLNTAHDGRPILMNRENLIKKDD